MAQEKLKIAKGGEDVPVTINLEIIDENWHLRDTFVKALIAKRANSVEWFMGGVYLAQFLNLTGEFAVEPVFEPDFHIRGVPYSSALIRTINNVTKRFGLSLPDGKLHVLDHHFQPSKEVCIEHLQREGAQLGRLYDKTVTMLYQYERPEDFFDVLGECHRRDVRLRDSLEYLTRP